jgi:hypothetical protein
LRRYGLRREQAKRPVRDVTGETPEVAEGCLVPHLAINQVIPDAWSPLWTYDPSSIR